MTIMEWIDIHEEIPDRDCCQCEILTNKDRVLIVDYYADYGIFVGDNDEYGWIDTGGLNELVIKWRYSF